MGRLGGKVGWECWVGMLGGKVGWESVDGKLIYSSL